MRAIAAATSAMVVILLLVDVQNAQESAKKDLAILEGEWLMLSGQIDGEKMPEELLKEMLRVAKDGETTVTMSGKVFLKAKYTIDPTKRPKTIDYAFSEGPTKGKKSLGIYEIEGDTVKFCFSRPDMDRPTDFTSKEGSGRTLSVWKRKMKS